MKMTTTAGIAFERAQHQSNVACLAMSEAGREMIGGIQAFLERKELDQCWSITMIAAGHLVANILYGDVRFQFRNQAGSIDCFIMVTVGDETTFHRFE